MIRLGKARGLVVGFVWLCCCDNITATFSRREFFLRDATTVACRSALKVPSCKSLPNLKSTHANDFALRDLNFERNRLGRRARDLYGLWVEPRVIKAKVQFLTAHSNA